VTTYETASITIRLLVVGYRAQIALAIWAVHKLFALNVDAACMDTSDRIESSKFRIYFFCSPKDNTASKKLFILEKGTIEAFVVRR